ncbi:MAG: Xaa-Pro dipeptidyl-peptidase [Planctomycetes bacterium]|nr:Xaa-Pro dipeptidyl-peptidase [Planctomycetota bacterium]
MRILSPRSVPFTCLLLVGSAAAQDAAAPAKAAPVFENGEAQVVPEFKNTKQWIREWVFVEAPFDSDGDGRPDRLHVDITRPRQTASEGLKVPVIYETSPYFAGTGPMNLSYYHRVEQELGAPTPARPVMQPIPWPGGEPGMIVPLHPGVARWVQRGYAVVHSCSPGTGWSQGCPSVGGPNESLAPRAVIDWLCGRAKAWKTLDGTDQVVADWCSGKVGMTGTSYNGALPIAAATTGVSGLAAIIPISPPASWYLYYRSHGLVRSPGGYLGEDMDVLFDFVASCEPKRRDWCIEHVREQELVQGFDRVHGDYNAFWEVRDYLAHLDAYTCPTLAVHGFNDWNVMPEHSVELYTRLKQKGVPCMIYMHQGEHGGEPPMSLMNRWFTRYLFDVENGIEQEARAWVVREGDKRTDATAYADYPNPEAKPVLLRPRGDGLGLGELGPGDAGTGSLTFVDDVAFAGGKLAAAEKSPHRLLFATAELKAPLHISGAPRVTLRLAANKPATNLSVWLVTLPYVDNPRKPYTSVVTRGWADPQNTKSLRESTPLVPGQPVELGFDLEPDDQVIPAGQRLALMIFASDREFTLWPPAGTELTVDLGATSLTLPVVGGEAALQKALRGDGR